MRTGRLCALWMASLALYACAKGGATSDDVTDDPDAPTSPMIDSRVTIDSAVNPMIDASPPADANLTPDAFVPPIDAFVPPPDAGNPPFCAINNDCTVVGTCCFFFQCVEGTGVGEKVCFPA